MKAVVLAGGFGTRIHPLTYSLPKPMLPLAGKPILEHVVDLLKNHGIKDLVFLLYFQPDVIKSHFGDGSDFGVKITYTTPTEDYGTAGAVKFAEEHLGTSRTFLVISGDLLANVDLTALARFHKDHKAVATIGLTSVEDPLKFGIVITDPEGRIVKFLEKPGWGEVFSDNINAGIYVLDKSVLGSIPEQQNYDFSQDLFPTLLEKEKALFGYLLGGYWRDVGDTTSYWQANCDILGGKVSVKGVGQRLDIVGKNIWMDSDVEIAEGAELSGTVILGAGSRVARSAVIANSVIGKNVVINEDVKITDSTLWDDVHVDTESSIDGTVICSDVRVGKEVRIERGVVIAEGCSVGNGAHVREGVKIWPRKEIESRSIVSSNVVWGERWKRSLFEEAKVKGLANFELTPEFAAKLGAAFGSMFPKGSYVMMGRDTYTAPRMIKRAFIAGALSAGINVNDLKQVPIPIMRNRLATGDESGGAYFRYSPESPEVTEILFYDADGYESSASFEKLFERIFQREDFRRVTEDAVGRITDIRTAVYFYNQKLLGSINKDIIRSKRYRIIIDFSFGLASEYFPSVLNDLGCEVISLNGFTMQHSRKVNNSEALNLLSNMVTATKANGAFWLDPWAQRLHFVDEKGRSYRMMDSFLLLFHLVVKAEEPCTIAVPLFVPSYLEKYSLKRGFEIQRTKNSVRSVAAASGEKGVEVLSYPDGRFIFSSFQHAYDGMYALAKTLEMTAKTNTTLSEIGAEIPKINFIHTTIPCPWESKGVVMRKASEEAMEKDATFIDGVKTTSNGSWVLLFPDQYHSFIHLYAEARSDKKAQGLIDKYSQKVEHWISD